MLSVEAGSILNNYSRMKQGMNQLIQEPLTDTRDQQARLSCVDLIKLGCKSYLLHSRIRKIIQTDDTLPQVVSNDPPSLRANLWMIIIDEAMNPTGSIPRKPDEYPLRLYALTRCYLNGIDDIMDTTKPPINKADFKKNDKFASMESALAREFRTISRENPLTHHRVRKSLRGYLLAINNWIDEYNIVEQDKDNLDFDKALKYTIMTMGPMTFILNYTVAVKHDFSGLAEENLNEALVWYATAGKLIDDMTDWYKDQKNGQLNLFSLAMKESGELDRVVQATRFFAIFGRKAFVPITLHRLLAPKATEKVLSIVDGYIEKVRDCGYDRLTSSMVGIRHMMWAYALNEGLPQV